MKTINKNINKEVNVDITDINYEGMGIANLNDKCLFVEGAITDENVDCVIDFENKSFYRGHAVKINQQSPFRIKPKCATYDKCGGCQLLHLDYQESLKYKLKSVNNTLKRIGNVDFEVKEIIGMDELKPYRNKVQIKAGKVEDHLVLGYFERRSHNIVPFKNCILQSNEINEMTNFIKNILNEFHLQAYDENTKQGDIKHVMIRENKNKEMMIVFVVSKKKIEHEKELVDKLLCHRWRSWVHSSGHLSPGLSPRVWAVIHPMPQFSAVIALVFPVLSSLASIVSFPRWIRSTHQI